MNAVIGRILFERNFAEKMKFRHYVIHLLPINLFSIIIDFEKIFKSESRFTQYSLTSLSLTHTLNLTYGTLGYRNISRC